jgi:hypothetical protein
MSSKRKTADDVLLAAEAALMLLTAKVSVRSLPLRILGRYRGPKAEARGVEVDRICLAVERAARRLPLSFVCYPRALAVHWMLRRRGIWSMLHFGIRPPSADFAAHVWTSLGERILVGEEGAAGFAAVATYPASADPSSQSLGRGA